MEHLTTSTLGSRMYWQPTLTLKVTLEAVFEKALSSTFKTVCRIFYGRNKNLTELQMTNLVPRCKFIYLSKLKKLILVHCDNIGMVDWLIAHQEIFYLRMRMEESVGFCFCCCHCFFVLFFWIVILKAYFGTCRWYSRFKNVQLYYILEIRGACL